MRLDKYIAHTTDLSRRQARQLTRAGAVSVDGVVVSDPAAMVSASAVIAVDGEPLRRPGYRYFMLHKPLGYICANHDPVHPVIMDLLAEDNLDLLHCAGRLDIDATGLVLITDDGQWSHRIRSPRHGYTKTYHVEVDIPIPPNAEQRFAKGLFLPADERRTRPAELMRIDAHTARLVLTEGRYHQVKRMFAAVGCTVETLHREQIGGVRLDTSLLPGEYRALSAEEVAILAANPP